METRSSQFEKSEINRPCDIYLEWKSDHKSFMYYDKDTKTNKPVTELKFIVIKEFNTVAGYDEKNNCGIYANEVARIAEEVLTVKSYKGGKLASGLWTDIKDQVADAGGKYAKSLYVMTEKGVLLNINLSGIAVSSWIDFASKAGQRLADEWVKFSGTTEGKKGRVTYHMPNFIFDGSLSAAHASKADECFAELKRLLTTGGKPSEREAEVNAESPALASPGEDDLPF
jgi:hypothetical protein